MREITISQCKAQCLALLEQAQKTKKPIRVTRCGNPVVEVVPAAPQAPAGDWIGSIKDSMKIVGDIGSSASDETDWAALRD
jgi:prevent-host-death family protein